MSLTDNPPYCMNCISFKAAWRLGVYSVIALAIVIVGAPEWLPASLEDPLVAIRSTVLEFVTSISPLSTSLVAQVRQEPLKLLSYKPAILMLDQLHSTVVALAHNIPLLVSTIFSAITAHVLLVLDLCSELSGSSDYVATLLAWQHAITRSITDLAASQSNTNLSYVTLALALPITAIIQSIPLLMLMRECCT